MKLSLKCYPFPLLDPIPAMSDSDRIAWDPVLIYSACVLQEKFEMDLTTAGDDLLDEDSGRLTGLLTETITAAS